MSKEFYTDYKTAATWSGCRLILCNNITTVDPNLFDNLSYVNIGEPEDDEDYSLPDFYQFYLTDLSDWQKEWQENTFDLIYAYSEVLDLWVLCVDHWGTAWDYVPCTVKSNEWIDINKDKEYKH